MCSENPGIINNDTQTENVNEHTYLGQSLALRKSVEEVDKVK